MCFQYGAVNYSCLQLAQGGEQWYTPVWTSHTDVGDPEHVGLHERDFGPLMQRCAVLLLSGFMQAVHDLYEAADAVVMLPTHKLLAGNIQNDASTFAHSKMLCSTHAPLFPNQTKLYQRL